MKWNEFVNRAKFSLKTNFKDVSFLLKFSALVLNLVALLVWRVPAQGATGLIGNSQECLFSFTVPAYDIILSALVIIYLLEEKPQKLFLNILILSGSILFGIAGSVALYNYFYIRLDLGVPPLVVAILSLFVSFLLLVDVLIMQESVNFPQSIEQRLSQIRLKKTSHLN